MILFSKKCSYNKLPLNSRVPSVFPVLKAFYSDCGPIIINSCVFLDLQESITLPRAVFQSVHLNRVTPKSHHDFTLLGLELEEKMHIKSLFKDTMLHQAHRQELSPDYLGIKAECPSPITRKGTTQTQFKKIRYYLIDRHATLIFYS